MGNLNHHTVRTSQCTDILYSDSKKEGHPHLMTSKAFANA